MTSTNNVLPLPTETRILEAVARELTLIAVAYARDFFLSDPDEYREFDGMPEECLMDDDLESVTPAGYPASAMREAYRITGNLNLLCEAERFEEATGGDYVEFARRLARTAVGQDGGLVRGAVEMVVSGYRKPNIPFSTYNPWDGGLMRWLGQFSAALAC